MRETFEGWCRLSAFPDASGALDAQELKQRLDIVEVVSEYVKLKKTGKNYVGLCPFHTETKPSFTVSPDRGLFYCYGCQTGGDVITFVEKVENLSFVEAAERLAQRIGAHFAARGDYAQRAALRQWLHAANRMAAVYYARLLAQSPRAEVARRYIAQRKIAQASVEQFMLGYALPEWEDLRQLARRKGFSDRDLVQAGLCVARESGAGCYDRFRGRLMFPIFDAQGNVVGFGARALGDDEPKYINSPETAIFQKGKLVYGLRQAAPAIKGEDYAVVVEGYTDVIACHEAGVKNVVATLGTALTADHLRLLRRYCSRVVLAFDADQAGVAAVLRNVPQLERTGMDVRVAALPEGSDPDQMVRERGPEALLKLVRGAVPLVHFAIDRLIAAQRGAGPRWRQQAARAIVELLSELADEVATEDYVAYAAGELAGEDLARAGANEQALANQVRLARRRGRRRRVGERGSAEEAATASAAATAQALEAAPRGVLLAERIALRGAAEDPEVAREVFAILQPAAFCDPIDRELAERAAEELARNGRIEARTLADGLSREAVERWAEIQLDEAEVACDERSAVDCAREVADYRKRMRMRELEAALRTGEGGAASRELLEEYQELVRYFSEKTARRSSL